MFILNKKNTSYLLNCTMPHSLSCPILDYTHNNIFFAGKKTGEFKWEFSIPDSIVSKSEYMIMVVPNQKKTNTVRQIKLFSNIEGTQNSFAGIGLNEEFNFIEANYLGQETYKNENISEFLNDKDTIITGNIICESFNLILKQDDSDITIRAQDPFFAWFYDTNQKKSYKEHLVSYLDLAKRYPDSRYLLSNLSENLNKFKSKKDVSEIYKNFSGKYKATIRSKKIERYLDSKFQNTSLYNFDLSSEELIIQDSTKYNLITFTASWCTPCLEEIPLLKSIHQDLKEHVNFIYVSLDKEKDVAAFQKIATENSIPWRTLFAYKVIEQIKNLYYVRGIPYSLLVYPSGNIEVINIRAEENRKEFYKIVTQ